MRVTGSRLKGNSILKRILFTMLTVLIIQTLFLAGSIRYGGTVEELDKNALAGLSERVSSRRDYLQREMIQRWSRVEGFEENIQILMTTFLQKHNISIHELKDAPDLVSEFLQHSVDHVITALRQQTVTGAFVILAVEHDGEFPGIYIRDSDPLLNSLDNSDLSMLRGPSAVARNVGLSLGMGWEPRFSLNDADEESAFFYRPYRATRVGVDAVKLGYWGKPINFCKYGEGAITYSVPLVDDNGNTYGVIGVDLTMDYLKSTLPYDEIAENKCGAYLLATTTDGPLTFKNILYSGPMFNRWAGCTPWTQFDESSHYKNTYLLHRQGDDTDSAYGGVHLLELYNRDSPYVGEQWVLIGVADAQSIFKASSKIRRYAVLSLIFTIAAGIVGAVFAGLWFTKPIRALAKRLRESDPRNPIVLGKTDILEIDDLTGAIEAMSQERVNFASKLAKVIELVDMPLGAFEYIFGEDRVFCTKALLDLLDIGEVSQGSEVEYIPPGLFLETLEALREQPEANFEDTYRYETSSGPVRWLQVKTQESPDRILGVVKDVTQEVIKTLEIEYERDHDPLTRLLNRRAYEVKVKEMLSGVDIGMSAFVMWDLDNLKTINDTCGHDYGDQYLKAAAKILKELEEQRAIVARMSGDEFQTFIYGYTSQDEIRQIVSKTSVKMRRTEIQLLTGARLPISATAGIAWYPEDSTVYRQLLTFSDFAMYMAKGKGGGIGEFDREGYSKRFSCRDGRDP